MGKKKFRKATSGQYTTGAFAEANPDTTVAETPRKRGERVTKDELIKELAQRTGETQASAKRFLEAFVLIVEEELASDAEVRLTGLGTFKTVDRAARTGVIEGKKWKKGPTKAVKFRAHSNLKEAVNA